MEIRALIKGDSVLFSSHEEKLNALYANWQEFTAGRSIIEYTHFSYLQIIGMGMDAVPFILKKFEHRDIHGLLALRCICGYKLYTEAPVEIDEIRKLWLEWGKTLAKKDDMFQSDPHYLLIKDHYGDTKAKRSGVLYINHINEGLSVLRFIGATENAMRAYCLHPLTQGDGDLVENMEKMKGFTGDIWPWVLTMEYRRVANAYLSTRIIKFSSHLEQEIELSPLKEVNDMLIADKVQNRADFELHHQNTHPRAEELMVYFRNWMLRLGISEEKYQEYAGRMKTPQI